MSTLTRLNDITAEGLMASIGVERDQYPAAPALRHFFNFTVEGFTDGAASELAARGSAFEMGVELHKSRLERLNRYKADFFDVYCDPSQVNENALIVAAIFDEYLFDIDVHEPRDEYFGIAAGDIFNATAFVKEAFDMMAVSGGEKPQDDGDDETFAEYDGDIGTSEFKRQIDAAAANDETRRLLRPRPMDIGVTFGTDCFHAQDDIFADNDNKPLSGEIAAESAFLAHLMMFDQVEALERDLEKIGLNDALSRFSDCLGAAESFLDTDTDIGKDLSGYLQGVERRIEYIGSHKGPVSKPSPEMSP